MYRKCLEDFIGEDRQVRVVYAFVEELDLQALVKTSIYEYKERRKYCEDDLNELLQRQVGGT